MSDQSETRTNQWDLGDFLIFSGFVVTMLIAPVLVAVVVDLEMGALVGSGSLWWILGYESGLIPQWKGEVMDRV